MIQLKLLAAEETRTFFEMVPLLPITSGLHFAIAGLLVTAIVAFIVWMYIRDGVELPGGLTSTLGLLRVLAFLGLILFFINPEKRSEQRVTKTSRLPILVDTSLSMGIRDRQGSQVDPPSRMESVRNLLAQPDFIDPLRANHDVIVYRFDEGNRPEEIVTLPKQQPNTDATESVTVDESKLWNQNQALARMGLTLALFGTVVHLGCILI